jgi:ribosome biogenesis protein Nip4
MSLLSNFVRSFSDIEITDVVQIGKDVFQIPPALDATRKSIDKRINREASYAGLLLGSMRGKRFVPAPALLDLIAPHTQRWITVDEKAEWLFLCGRDVFGCSILKANVDGGIALVLNRHKEVLGYGSVVTRDKGRKDVFVKNLLDKGDFLRREMDH